MIDHEPCLCHECGEAWAGLEHQIGLALVQANIISENHAKALALISELQRIVADANFSNRAGNGTT